MWKDETIYTQSDKERIPRTWEAKSSKGFRVLVHRHVYEPGRWFVTCGYLGLDKNGLASLTAEDAKREAIRVCERRLKALALALTEISAFPTK